MKMCTSCLVEKSTDEFGKDKHRKDGLRSYCKVCDRAKSAAKYQDNIERRREYFRNRQRGMHSVYRLAALQVYGGKCVECGSTEALELDHVNGGGTQHRKVEHHSHLYRRIARLGKPIEDHELQLLCRPHHLEKSRREREAA